MILRERKYLDPDCPILSVLGDMRNSEFEEDSPFLEKGKSKYRFSIDTRRARAIYLIVGLKG